MNEHNCEGNKLKESAANGRPERVRFIFGKDLTPEQIADEIKRSYREHFGTEMFPTKETK
jgi:hypothetical protein